MKTIPLTQGKEALVDDEDYDLLMQWKWYAVKSRNTFYARRQNGKGLVRMHNVIHPTPLGLITDHKDGNGLNNQRENLRTVTYSQNSCNKRIQCDNTSGVKGVSWNPQHKKWFARVMKDGKRFHVGRFDSMEEAANEREKAVLKIHGEFAKP